MITPSRHIGILLVVVSAICWSSAGLFARMANMDSASLVVWSSCSAGLALGIACAVHLKRDFLRAIRNIGTAGWLYVFVASLNTISLVVALNYTSVANVMTIYASLPFVATAIAFLWINERVSRRFIVAGTVAIIGVTVTAGAAANANDAVGLIAAAVTTVTFAGQFVIVKRFAGINVLLVSAISAWISAAVTVPFMSADLPSSFQIGASAMYGIIPYGLGTFLALIGGRLIKSGEAGFVSMLDVVLSPVWVWLFFNENPGAQAVAGCAMVLGAVAWYLSERPRSPEFLRPKRADPDHGRFQISGTDTIATAGSQSGGDNQT